MAKKGEKQRAAPPPAKVIGKIYLTLFFGIIGVVPGIVALPFLQDDKPIIKVAAVLIPTTIGGVVGYSLS